MSKLYSKKSLVEKLGIKKDLSILVVNSPYNYGNLLGNTIAKIEFPVLKEFLEYNSAFWVSWPKKSSRINTDLNENIIREIGLENGLVDVKVISINDVWSGLKFVYRMKDRL